MVVGCAVIDGPVSAPDLNERRVATYRAVDAPATRSRRSGGRVTHASQCIRMILSVEPRAEVHAIQVFSEDGIDVPAANVLRGLEVASEMPVDVICLPSTIARTRLEGRFREVCSAATARGILVVAAWASGAPRAVPASFPSVVGVARAPRPSPTGPLITQRRSSRAVALPMSASGGTALVSGLACAYVALAGETGPRPFTEGIIDFAKRAAAAGDRAISVAADRGRGEEGALAAIGDAYRRYLSDRSLRTPRRSVAGRRWLRPNGPKV